MLSGCGGQVGDVGGEDDDFSDAADEHFFGEGVVGDGAGIIADGNGAQQAIGFDVEDRARLRPVGDETAAGVGVEGDAGGALPADDFGSGLAGGDVEDHGFALFGEVEGLPSGSMAKFSTARRAWGWCR